MPDYLSQASLDKKNEGRSMQKPIDINSKRIVFDRARLIEAFEQAPAFVAMLTGEDHVFEWVNPAYYQLVGHRDILGKPIRIALPEVVGQGYVELLNEVLQTGKPFIGKGQKVLLQVAPDASLTERYVDFVYQARRNNRGEIIGIFAHGVDVTDLVIARQQSETRAQQLSQQAHTFDTMLTHISDFVYTFDRMGRFTFANKPLLDLLDISSEEIVGKNFHDLPYPAELATTLQTHIQHVVEAKE